MAYDIYSTVVSSATHLATHLVMNWLGFKQRTTRQAASIAAITSMTALDLYSNPSLNNVAHLLTTAGGASIG